VVTDRHVADAADDDPERQPDRRRVHDLEEPVPGPPHDRVREDHRPGDAADQADPALPDPQRAQRIVGEVGPVSEHVEEASADDGADERPQQDGADPLLREATLRAAAEHEPGSREVTERDPDPVRRHRQRTEAQAVEDGPANDGEQGQGAHAAESIGAPWG
jgi:hypothetical protein